MMEYGKMDSSEFVGALEALFELPAGSLSLSSVIEETPGWGSLKFLCLIGLIDDRFGVTLKPRQIHQCSTFADLYSLVNTYSKG
jgi:acyl carrier protein